MNLVEYPLDEKLVEIYNQIGKTGIEGIKTGTLVGNPLLTKKIRGDRWSIATHGLINGSSAGDFLETVCEYLMDYAKISWVPFPFQHFTLTELIYSPTTRKDTGVSSDQLVEYHRALLENFPQNLDLIKLRLHRIIPTLDPEQPGIEGRTGALVASFLTDGDKNIFRVKEELVSAVKKAELPFSARLGGPPKVLFVTLGYFIKPPLQIKDEIPFLTKIDEINSRISDLFTDIQYVTVISTTGVDYALPRGHIEIWPPVALSGKDQIQGSVKLLRPTQRLWYHRLQKILMEKQNG